METADRYSLHHVSLPEARFMLVRFPALCELVQAALMLPVLVPGKGKDGGAKIHFRVSTQCPGQLDRGGTVIDETQRVLKRFAPFLIKTGFLF